MAAKYFHVLTKDTTIFDGTHLLDSAQATAKPGRVTVMGSDGELELCAVTDRPYGLLQKSTSKDLLKPSYDYAADTDLLRVSARQTIVKGTFEAQIDAEGFHGGSVPAVNTVIYTGPSGLLAITDLGSATRLGLVTANDTVQSAWSSTTSVARIAFDIPGN